MDWEKLFCVGVKRYGLIGDRVYLNIIYFRVGCVGFFGIFCFVRYVVYFFIFLIILVNVLYFLIVYSIIYML